MSKGKKIGKSVLGRPGGLPKLSEAEIKALKEWEEEQRRKREEEKAEQKEMELEAETVSLPKEKPPAGIVEHKGEGLKELSGIIQRLASARSKAEETEDVEEEEEEEKKEKEE